MGSSSGSDDGLSGGEAHGGGESGGARSPGNVLATHACIAEQDLREADKLSHVVRRALDHHIHFPGKLLAVLREELGKRTQAGPRRNPNHRATTIGVNQLDLQDVAKQHGIFVAQRPLTARVISHWERKRPTTPIKDEVLRALYDVLCVIEERHAPPASHRQEKARLTKHYSYQQHNTLNVLRDSGFVYAEEISCDMSVQRLAAERVEDLLACSVDAHTSAADATRVNAAVRERAGQYMLVVWICMRGLEWRAEGPRKLFIDHTGHEDAIWRLADASQAKVCRALRPQALYADEPIEPKSEFRRGICAPRGQARLRCEPLDPGMHTRGSLAYELSFEDTNELTICVVGVGAFDSRDVVVPCAGFPMTMLARRLSVGVAFERGTFDGEPPGLRFQAFPILRAKRAPTLDGAEEPSWRQSGNDSRLDGTSSSLRGRRMVCARPIMNYVYGWRWNWPRA